VEAEGLFHPHVRSLSGLRGALPATTFRLWMRRIATAHLPCSLPRGCTATAVHPR